MPQSYIAMHCHLVFSTKNRAALIDAPLQSRLYEYLGGIARGLDCVLLVAGGMPDHVHLLVSTNKETSLANLLRELKAKSSNWVHETFSDRRTFAWRAGYGAFSVSLSQMNAVKYYLANQPEHHRTRTFQEAFIELLRKHHVSFEGQYLWA